MSRIYDYFTQCAGKHKFANSNDAWRAASRGKGGRAYHCTHCGSWHIARKPSKKHLNWKRNEARTRNPE